MDNLSTPASPEYVPPFTIFAPWCFRALLLPDTYQRGRMYALRLLCLLTVRPQDTPLPRTHLIQFYKVNKLFFLKLEKNNVEVWSESRIREVNKIYIYIYMNYYAGPWDWKQTPRLACPTRNE